jgi:hypothetical protein
MTSLGREPAGGSDLWPRQEWEGIGGAGLTTPCWRRCVTTTEGRQQPQELPIKPKPRRGDRKIFRGYSNASILLRSRLKSTGLVS